MPRCSRCPLAPLCIPTGLGQDEIGPLDVEIDRRVRIRKGQPLFRQGDAHARIYAVRSGTLKAHRYIEDGREQTTGFRMQGDVLGLDSIDEPHHVSTATALEDSEICALPGARASADHARPALIERQLLRLASREIRRDDAVRFTLSAMSAEGRVAWFLLSLSERFTARGYSGVEFNLRMTRDDIGRYLGIQLETVSRSLSRFTNEGWVAIAHRRVRLLDRDALGRIGAGAAPDNAAHAAAARAISPTAVLSASMFV
ncbi:helix-turn-helix domain-containing protein [Pararobbsia silviterrae]|nr:helix-turn-helix domain-containing protein [Pararobbsia silviterrae]